jgi:3-hydroxyacyl-CoA dehydrogenase/enoyl-CoA hydratase/3-hydroxybutyryl-CoA epimerase
VLGLQGALPYLTIGKTFSPAPGEKLAPIHQIVGSADILIEEAVRWIKSKRLDELVAGISTQPWDVKSYKISDCTPRD